MDGLPDCPESVVGLRQQGEIIHAKLPSKHVRKPRPGAKLTRLRKAPGYYYLASPFSLYADGLEAAWIAACKAAGRLISLRVPIYCPIAETYPVALHSGMDPLDGKLWLKADRPKMDAAFGLIVLTLPGWNESAGVIEEIRTFKAAAKPIEYIDPEELA